MADIVPMPKGATEVQMARETKKVSARAIATSIMESAAQTVLDAQGFSEIDPNASGPPQEWIDELGEKRAWKKFRVAMAAWEPTSKQPAGLAAATAITASSLRNFSSAGPSSVNIVAKQVVMPVPGAPQDDFERVIVDDGEDG